MTVKEFGRLTLTSLPAQERTWERRQMYWLDSKQPFHDPENWENMIRLYEYDPITIGPASVAAYTVNSLFYKRSIGSELSQSLRKRIRMAVETTGLVRYRKPKEPTWYPHEFRQKPPQMFPTLEEFQAARPISNAASDAQKQRYLKWQERQHEQLMKAWQRRQMTYFVKYQKFLAREETRRAAYEKRLLKFQERKRKYELSLKAAMSRLLRWLPSSYFGYEEHEYFYVNLRTNDNGFAYLWTMWDNLAGDPINNGWATDLKVNPFTFASQADVNSCLFGFSQSVGRSLAAALRKKDLGLSRKLYSKITDQKLHVGNLFGEGLQTIDLIATTWQRLAKLVMLKKGLLKSAFRVLNDPKKVSNEILQWKFGAEPLIRDLKEAIQDYLDSNLEDSQILKFKVGRKHSLLQLKAPGVTFTGSASMSYTANYAVDHSYLRKLSQYGLIDPLQVAWEVTPWSFVVDWLIPVGEWIASLTADYGLDFNGVTCSAKFTGEFILDNPVGLDSEGFPFRDCSTGITGNFSGTIHCREVNLPLPDKDLIIRAKNPYSLSHLIEAIALTIQRLR